MIKRMRMDGFMKTLLGHPVLNSLGQCSSSLIPLSMKCREIPTVLPWHSYYLKGSFEANICRDKRAYRFLDYLIVHLQLQLRLRRR